MSSQQIIYTILVDTFGPLTQKQKMSLWRDVLRANVHLDADSIKQIFLDFNVVMLRPPLEEQVLLIGCGNHRPNISPPKGTSVDFVREHRHEGAYTMDQNIQSNPSVILLNDWGETSISGALGGKRFMKIFVETSFDILEPKTYTLTDMVTLLDAMGVLVLSGETISPTFEVGVSEECKNIEEGPFALKFGGVWTSFNRIVYTYDDLVFFLSDPSALIPTFSDLNL
jgi:hypothetical protein